MKLKFFLPFLILILLFLAGGYVFSELTAEKVQVTKRLRMLLAATVKYMDDKGSWPQCPFDGATEQQAYSDWWISALEPYGVDEEIWRWDGSEEGLSFLPTEFESNKFEPFRHDRPWFRTVFTFGEEKESLAVFPDGSVKALAKPGAESSSEKGGEAEPEGEQNQTLER